MKQLKELSLSKGLTKKSLINSLEQQNVQLPVGKMGRRICI